MRPEKISSDVVKALANNSEQAFETIYHFYKDRTYFFFIKFCKDTDQAEELLQALFVKLWEKRESVRSDTNFESFLFTIAKHLALDFLKSKSREELYELHALSPTPNVTEQDVYFHELQSMANLAIDALPEKRQIIYRMNYEEGLSIAQISETLKLSPHTVKAQLNKASQTVRLYLRSKGEVILGLLFIPYIF